MHRLTCLLVLISAVTPQQTQRPSLEFKTDTQKIRVVTLVEGLDSPWSMVFLPSGDILVTERPGRLRLISNGKLQDEPIAGLPEIQFGTHGGLLDVALHPNFDRNKLIYLTYSKGGERGVTTAVARGRLEGKRLVDATDVFVADSWTKGSLNPGSRVVFDKDGMLYASIGDRGQNERELILNAMRQEIRDIRQGPDGLIYLVTRQDAEHTPKSGMVLRIEPVE
jgi:aldose sugar dehydrogenase